MLHVQCFTFNLLSENTYVIYDDTRACAIVDPGCYEHEEQRILDTFIKKSALKVTQLINTHAHVDHSVGNHHVKTTYGVSLALHEQEVPILHAAARYATDFGFLTFQATEAEVLLEANDKIRVGDTWLSVLHVPGHSPGHIALYSQKYRLCLSGDVLFKSSIGRTDLPGGDHKTLLHSIHEQLLPLGDDVVLHPGHGPEITIGEVRSNNYFL